MKDWKPIGQVFAFECVHCRHVMYDMTPRLPAVPCIRCGSSPEPQPTLECVLDDFGFDDDTVDREGDDLCDFFANKGRFARDDVKDRE
jgi:hypothetical protein